MWHGKRRPNQSEFPKRFVSIASSFMVLFLFNISGKTCGLCGNYNDNQNDDFTSPSGSIEVSPSDFGDTWRVREYCAFAKSPEHPCKIHKERAAWSKKTCGIIKQDVFKPCHDVVRNI
jgi:hypothetical protein